MRSREPRTTTTKAHVYEEIRYVRVEVTDGFRTAVYTEDIAEPGGQGEVAQAARTARSTAHRMLDVLQEVDADA